MKIGRWMGVFVTSIIISSSTVQAATITDSKGQVVTIDEVYIDTSQYQINYNNTSGFLVSPLQVPGELLAPFGQSREGYSHQGIDIRAALGTPIYAIGDGVITKASPDSKGVENGGGHMIFLDLGNGMEGRYMHLGAYGVKVGDQVKAGQVIGFTGSTGDSTTPHLHFEYHIYNEPVDPSFIFEQSQIITISNDSKLESTSNYNANLQKNSFYVIQQ